MNEKADPIENELLLASSRMTALVQNVPDGILMQSADGCIAYVNPALISMLGWDALPEDLAGVECDIAIEQVKRSFEDSDGFARDMNAILETRQPVSSRELRMGDGRILEQDYVPVMADGQFVGHLCTFRDVTERKGVEETLVAARKEAEASARARERFLANMSHEMRTPLNAILGMTHLLREIGPGPQRDRYLDSIKFSADNLLALINDLLDITKIKAGKIVFENVSFDPRHLLAHSLDVIAPRARSKRLSLERDVDTDLPAALVGDPVRLNQILLNLLSNAVKFTEEGSIRLRVAARETGPDGVELIVAVSDTGIGIAKSKQEAVFESFEQERSDTTRRYGGTGLGLSIVKELVERQGGRVELESEIGHGSTFTVKLPFRIATAAEKEPLQEIHDLDALKGARILVVEDNEFNREVVVGMLASWGAQADVAVNGLEALQRLGEQAYDAVLMDIQMPVMDGFEATLRIRTELGLDKSDLPILVVTASVLQERRRDLLDLGVNDFILKPFEPVDLHTRLAAAIRRRSAPDESSARAGGRSHVDVDRIDRTAMGDPVFALRIIDILLKQLPEYADAMAEAVGSDDRTRARFLAHKMKASAASAGLSDLVETLREIEQIGSGDLQSLLEEVESVVPGAVEELRTLRQTYLDA